MSRTISINGQDADAAASLLLTAGQSALRAEAGLHDAGIAGAVITRSFDSALRRWVDTCANAARESSRQLEKAHDDVSATLADLRDIDEQIAAHLARAQADLDGSAH